MKRNIMLWAVFLTSVGLNNVLADRPVSLNMYHGVRTRTTIGNVGASVIIAKHSENKLLIVECDSGELYRRSDEELAGEDSPVEINFSFLLSPGDYICVATLFRENNHEFNDRATIRVF